MNSFLDVSQSTLTLLISIPLIITIPHSIIISLPIPDFPPLPPLSLFHSIIN